MNFSLILRTVTYLKPIQLVFQVLNRIRKPRYKCVELADCSVGNRLHTEPISKEPSLVNEEFTFLNITQHFEGWNDISNGTLYTYNQNYFDYINSKEVSSEVACAWIDKFISEIETITWGMDPYPIALRSINWMKYFSMHPETANPLRLDSLWSQICHLQKKLEYHLLGNHLLEDAFALYIGGCFFHDENLLKKGYKLLKEQLNEQILNDGAHFEQSPMYHCILLDRLLDCYNFSVSNTVRGVEQSKMNDCLRSYASKMLGHLAAIVYSNGDIPLLNDSANRISPTSNQLFDYAERLGIKWEKLDLKESGYKHWVKDNWEAIIDVGNVSASYQPGHTHADTFNYELRKDNKPFIVDTGISTYEKNGRRQYERSTIAHNTVSINEADSSEVWGGFRVGRRATVKVYEESDGYISASHNGFPGVKCNREFINDINGFIVRETLNKHVEAKSNIHLAPGIQVIEVSSSKVLTSSGVIEIQNAAKVDVIDELVSKEYNQLIPIKKVVISFTEKMQYIVK